jgi:hypothetical protein
MCRSAVLLTLLAGLDFCRPLTQIEVNRTPDRFRRLGAFWNLAELFVVKIWLLEDGEVAPLVLACLRLFLVPSARGSFWVG